MTNRKILEAYFAKQRQARKKNQLGFPRNSHVTPRQKRIGYVAVILIVVFATLLTIWILKEVERLPIQQVSLVPTVGGSSDFIVMVVTATDSATSKEFAQNPIYETAIPTAFYVCTNVSNGLLHVRFEPGVGSVVRGYLTEGEEIRPALDANGRVETQEYQGGQWLHLSSPIKGWVNIKFICE